MNKDTEEQNQEKEEELDLEEDISLDIQENDSIEVPEEISQEEIIKGFATTTICNKKRISTNPLYGPGTHKRQSSSHHDHM